MPATRAPATARASARSAITRAPIARSSPSRTRRSARALPPASTGVSAGPPTCGTFCPVTDDGAVRWRRFLLFAIPTLCPPSEPRIHQNHPDGLNAGSTVRDVPKGPLTRPGTVRGERAGRTPPDQDVRPRRAEDGGRRGAEQEHPPATTQRGPRDGPGAVPGQGGAATVTRPATAALSPAGRLRQAENHQGAEGTHRGSQSIRAARGAPRSAGPPCRARCAAPGAVGPSPAVLRAVRGPSGATCERPTSRGRRAPGRRRATMPRTAREPAPGRGPALDHQTPLPTGSRWLHHQETTAGPPARPHTPCRRSPDVSFPSLARAERAPTGTPPDGTALRRSPSAHHEVGATG